MAENITAYTDGGSRGNPGPAAAAFILTDDKGLQLKARAFFLGRATNNVAEYTAVVKALEAAKQTDAKSITVFSDSELLVKQLNGQYRVKSDQLRPIFVRASQLLERFESWQVKHVTRNKNTRADKLVNRALNLGRDVEVEKPAGPDKKAIRLGVLLSGGGTTLMNILEYIKRRQLNATIAIVISSRSTVAGVERARNAGLNVKIVRKKDYPDIDEFSRRIT